VWVWSPTFRPLPAATPEDARAETLLREGDFREALVTITDAMERHGSTPARRAMRIRILSSAHRPDLVALARTEDSRFPRSGTHHPDTILTSTGSPAITLGVTFDPALGAELKTVKLLADAGDTNGLRRMRDLETLPEVVRAEAGRLWLEHVKTVGANR
jgi:hypothetical protein